MKALFLGLLLVVGCSKTPVNPVVPPANLSFMVTKTTGETIEGVLDADAKNTAKEYKSAIAVAVDGK